MPNTYYESTLTGEQIEAALTAIDGVIANENNGKLLAIENGKIVAKSASEWTDAPVLEAVTLTRNGTTTPPSGVDGFNSVTVAVPGAGNIESLTVTENGTYTPPTGVDGYAPVIVKVSGGSGEDWNEPIFRNWDFSNPVNTRGRQSYSGEKSINGWTCVSGTTCDLANGGIYVRGNDTNMYYWLDTDTVNYFDGKTFTLSLLANNKLATQTFTFTSSSVSQASVTVDNVTLWCNRDSSTRVAIGFQTNSSGYDTLIQAIKLELGSNQTLAKNSGDAWSLIRNQDQNEEIIFTRAMARNF